MKNFTFLFLSFFLLWTQLAGVIEYTDYISAKGKDPQ